MTAINFPNSPLANELHTVGDITWRWTGVAWETVSSEFFGIPAGGATGQVLTKIDGDDYNTEWQDNTSYSAISELTDVSISNLLSGDILMYNSESSFWESSPLAQVLYSEESAAWHRNNFLQVLLETELVSSDGGSYNTSTFAGTIDGGSYNTTSFSITLDGGSAGSI